MSLSDKFEHNASGSHVKDEQAFGEPQNNQDVVKTLNEELDALKKHREIENLKSEKLILQKDHQIEKLEAVIEKMKVEFEMEKLKSENALLKAEKQYFIPVKKKNWRKN